MSDVQRMDEMEFELNRQQDQIESLNLQVYQQQKKIDELLALCTALAQRMQDLSAQRNQTALPHEKPPHY